MTIQEIINNFTKENKEILFTKDNELTEIGVLAYTIIAIQITRKFFQAYIEVIKKFEKDNK